MKKNKLFKILSLTLAISSLGAMMPSMAHAEWKSNNNNWYYLDSTGKARTGWVQDNGDWYYIGSDGVMKTGWIQDGGNWYYCWSNGQMASDTTVDNYTLGVDGKWVVSASNAFQWIDAQGEHLFRIDVSRAPDDINAGKMLTNYNMELSEKDKDNLHLLAYNISKETLYLSEAKSQCIGKTVGNKIITDIKLFNQCFQNTQGISATNRVKTIKSSELYDYKSTSPYVYDEFLFFSGINSRSNEWECMRVVVEFGDI